MILLQGVVVEESHGKLLYNASNWFPINWAVVRAKCTPLLGEEDGRNNEQKGFYDVRVMLDLSEALMHVVGING